MVGWIRAALLLCISFGISQAFSASTNFYQLPPTRDLSLKDFLQLVAQHNESLQSKVIDVEIARRRARGAYGLFEPEFTASYSRESNRRENTAEQKSSQFTDTFSEQNNIYQSGIEALVPTGARVRLGYSLRDLQNNLQGTPLLGGFGGVRGGTNGEFQTFFGLSLTQPLLKNFGEAATLAEIRVAALNSDIAFQEYRRQLMIVISTAEASYWNLYLAQEQVRALRDSVAVAESILNDAREKVKAGRSAELEVLEAQAGVALRKNRLNDAIQKLYESANQVTTLSGSSAAITNSMVRAVDQPELLPEKGSFFESWQNAFNLNPDYVAQRHRCVLEGIRLAYANNQRLPELDLKASYGLNGLGTSPGDSWGDIERNDFKSWTLGFELRIPLGGDIKASNERAAAKLGQQKALIDLKSLENQIANAVHTATQKIRSRQESVPDAQSVVNYATNLLDTQIARLAAGKVEGRKVLEVEADVYEARNSLTEMLVQYRRALLERELIEGAVLKNRGFELTQAELRASTAKLASRGGTSGEDFTHVLEQLGSIYSRTNRTPEVAPELPRDPKDEALRRALHERIEEWKWEEQINKYPAPNTNAVETLPPQKPVDSPEEKLRRALRERLEDLKPGETLQK